MKSTQSNFTILVSNFVLLSVKKLEKLERKILSMIRDGLRLQISPGDEKSEGLRLEVGVRAYQYGFQKFMKHSCKIVV